MFIKLVFIIHGYACEVWDWCLIEDSTLETLKLLMNESELLVMTRSRQWPFLCVGFDVCSCNPKLYKSSHVCARAFSHLPTWMLKSPTIIKSSFEMIAESNRYPNSVSIWVFDRWCFSDDGGPYIDIDLRTTPPTFNFKSCCSNFCRYSYIPYVQLWVQVCEWPLFHLLA